MGSWGSLTKMSNPCSFFRKAPKNLQLNLLNPSAFTGTALRMTDIQLPSIAIFGKPAQLNCTYELGQDQLYSIKWFFNDQG